MKTNSREIIVKVKWFLILLIVLISCNAKTEQQLQKSLIGSVKIIQEYNTTINYDIADKLHGIKFELTYTPKKEQQQARYLRLKYFYERLCKIDSLSNNFVSRLDSIKIALSQYCDINKKNIQHDFFPKRIDLTKVPEAKLQTKVDDFFLNAGDKQSIATLLFNDFKKIRIELVKLIANYKWFEHQFEISLLPINQFKSEEELKRIVEKMIDSSNINSKEDRQAIIDLYIGLTLPEKIGHTSWEQSYFQGTTFLSALSKLTNLQNDIVRSKQLAIYHWFSKRGCGAECLFDKVVPIATGPMLVSANDTFEFKVFMGAFDSTGELTVKVNSENAKISYSGDGIGRVKVCLPKGIHRLKGTVTIQNRSGLFKTEEWEYKVNVIE